MTPAADRVRAYRARQKDAGLPDVSRKWKKKHDRDYRKSRPDKSFVGCDGEGCGVDAGGRQLYMLFRIGQRELFTGRHLSTTELLDFICESDADVILVGFAFGYDVTMILRDLPERQQRRLFEPKIFEKGHSRYVWYKDYDIDYLPKQYFRVKRVTVKRWRDAEGVSRETRIPVTGSQRTIYETFGFFQKSFLKCVNDFKIATEPERETIAANKARRSSFETIDREVRDYCGLECDLLARLMEQLRGNCRAAGIIPRSWNGAGKLASALHGLHETPKSREIAAIVPREVQDLANMAYYGGRFEITRIGDIRETVYEYDICSAYPDAMRNLPCLLHGRWEASSKLSSQDLFVASCHFNGPTKAIPLGGLPIRSREGHLYWPARGSGIYWSPEIRSAERLGYKVRLKNGYVFHRECDCCAFGWVNQLYEYRKSIGSQGAGYPIKLGINSLYGKLAQRKGNGVFQNMVWAGLITAQCRAKINEAISFAPESIVMIATDAVYSLKPLALDIGDRLGQWEAKTLNGLFIVQPGLYWCPAKRKRKSRGLSGNFFERPGLTESFEASWAQFGGLAANSPFPQVSVPVPNFVGLKLALARNKPEMAGTWIKETDPQGQRSISFDYRNKREGHMWQDGHIVVGIKPGSPGLVSLPHRDFLKAGGAEPWEAARSMLDEQPDYIDLGPPFED